MPPPPRRRPVPSTPSYRPKVAGLHKRAADRAEADGQAPATGAPPRVSPPDEVVPARADDGSTTTDHAGRAPADPTTDTASDQVAAPATPDATPEDEPVATDAATGEPVSRDGAGVPPVIGDRTADAADPAADDTPDTGSAPRPTGRGKRKSTRVPSPAPRAVPDAEADEESEAADAADAHADAGGGARSPLLLPLVLVLVAAVLAGLGFWFQTRSRDVRFNEALVDTGGTTEVSGQAREAVERAFSYNFADVAATESAANELLVGKARCQYNAIFGPVKTLAPEQKLVVTVRVVSSGVTSLVGDRATVLLFIDQVTTRTTDNQSGGGIAMMRVGAQRSDGRWKVDNMEMFGQTGDQTAEMAKCADAG